MKEHVDLKTERLLVRTPRKGDGAAFAAYYTDNREFLQPWSPIFRPEMYSVRDWEDSIPIIEQQIRQGTTLRFGLFQGERLIGVANITDIKGSPAFSGLLGYTLSSHGQGQGLMFEALEAILDHVFLDRNLHRITAGYMPRNERSGRLLRKLGFNVEGYARDYLLINGQWEDHVLTSLTNFDWRGAD